MDEAECKAKFRVETNGLHRVPEAMQIPGTLNSILSATEWRDYVCMLLNYYSNNFQYVSFIPYSNEKSELKTRN